MPDIDRGRAPQSDIRSFAMHHSSSQAKTIAFVETDPLLYVQPD